MEALKKRTRYEKPKWAKGLKTIYGDDITHFLPTFAVIQGCKLREVEYELADPIILYDRNYKILYEWQYTPSLTEVFEVCEHLLG